MIDAPGTITALDGDYAIVRMDETGCGRCHEEGGCGGNNIGKMFCSTPRTFRVLNPGHSVIGDHVTIVIAEGVVRRSAALAYGLPLLALIIGALAGSVLAGEIGAILGSLGGLLCSWLALHFAQLYIRPDQRTQPYIRY
jgi:sigma-E factor negative regulatory protein RseC